MQPMAIKSLYYSYDNMILYQQRCLYHSDDASAADASAAAADARLRMEPERAQPSMPVKAPDPGAREHDWLPPLNCADPASGRSFAKVGR